MFDSILSRIPVAALTAELVLRPSRWISDVPAVRDGCSLIVMGHLGQAVAQNKHREAKLHSPTYNIPTYKRKFRIETRYKACKHRRKFTWLPTRHKETIKPSLPVGLSSHPPSGQLLTPPTSAVPSIPEERYGVCACTQSTQIHAGIHTNRRMLGFQ